MAKPAAAPVAHDAPSNTACVATTPAAPHHLLSLSDPLAGEAAGADAEEGCADVAGHRLADERLAGAWRAKQQDALGRRTGALQVV
jgi:hypothetical protein